MKPSLSCRKLPLMNMLEFSPRTRHQCLTVYTQQSNVISELAAGSGKAAMPMLSHCQFGKKVVLPFRGTSSPDRGL